MALIQDLFFQSRPCTALILKKQFDLHFLPYIAFASKEQKEEVVQQIHASPIPLAAKRFGEKYHDAIATGFVPPVQIQWVNKTLGYGLFSRAFLPENAFIGSYTGYITTTSPYLHINNYAYSYPTKDLLGRQHIIDAEQNSNHCHFINHSAHPNLKALYAYQGSLYHLILIANRPIEPKEQLYFNYGPNYWRIRSPPINHNKA